MAIYHCSVKIGSRSKGQSAVAAAAYRSGTRLVNEETGQVSDYTKKRGVVHEEVSLCANAPEEYGDRETLWNVVHKVEKTKDAQLWREVEVAIPKEFSREEQIDTVREYVEQFTRQGMCADWSIHDKGDGNPHAHIMLTMRSIQEDGTWASKCRSEYVLDENGERIPLIDKATGKQKVDKQNRKKWKTRRVNTTDWDEPERIEEWRSTWENVCNKRLAPEAQIDHRSYAKQQKAIEPTIHEGYAASAMEKRGEESDRCRINRDIERNNHVLREAGYTATWLADEVRIQESIREKLGERFALYQEGMEQSPELLEAMEIYAELKNVEEELQEQPEGRKKEKYEKKHEEEFHSLWAAMDTLEAFYGKDEETFPSDVDKIKKLREQCEQGIAETEAEISSVGEALLALKRKRSVRVKLLEEMGEMLAENFAHAECWYKATTEVTDSGKRESVILLEKTSSEALCILQGSFPWELFPSVLRASEALLGGFADPMKEKVRMDRETAEVDAGEASDESSEDTSMTLEEYIRNGEAHRAIDECHYAWLQQFLGIKENIEELLPHTRLTIIDTDSKEIRESAVLLHGAALQNIKAVSRALNILTDQFSGEVETYPQLEKYCSEILPARCERLNKKSDELDRTRSVVQRYLKQRKSPYWTERTKATNKDRYDKKHAGEKVAFDKAKKEFKERYPNWNFKKNKLADEEKRLIADRTKICGIYGGV